MSKERLSEKYKKPFAVAALALATAASTPMALAAAKSEKRGVITRTAETAGEWKPLPPDLVKLLREVSTKDLNNKPILNLIGKPYRELEDFNLGNTKVRIVQVGGKFAHETLGIRRVESMKRYLDIFDKFAHSKANINIPYTEVKIGPGNQPYAINPVGNYQISPVSLTKDRVIFAVPVGFNIGSNRNGGPAAFTNRNSSIITSVVRPDFIYGDQSIAVEACQSAVRAKLSERNGLDVSYSASELNAMGQEIVCNTLGQSALWSSESKPYEDYVTSFSTLSVVKTAPPTPTHNGFEASLPYINSKKVYETLKHSVPKDIGSYLTYPRIG